MSDEFDRLTTWARRVGILYGLGAVPSSNFTTWVLGVRMGARPGSFDTGRGMATLEIEHEDGLPLRDWGKSTEPKTVYRVTLLEAMKWRKILMGGTVADGHVFLRGLDQEPGQ